MLPFLQLLMLSLFGLSWPALALSLEKDVPLIHLKPDQENDLQGQWLFIPEKFLNSADLRSLSVLETEHWHINIPGDLGAGRKVDPPKWGTAVIRVQGLLQAGQELGFRMRADTSASVYLVPMNDYSWNRILTVGRVADKREDSLPEVVDRLGKLPAARSDTAYLIIHISGWYYTKASIWQNPVIGPFQKMNRKLEIARISDTTVIAMIIIMLLYFICIHIYRPSDKSSKWLAITSASVCARQIATSGTVLDLIFPDPTLLCYTIIRKVEFGFVSVQGFAGLAFVVWTFDVKSLRKFLKYDGILALALTLFIILRPVDQVSSLVVLINVHVLAHILLAIGLSVRASLKKEIGSVAMLLGLLCILVTAIHDVAIANGLALNTGLMLSSYGVVGLIFCQGQILAIKFNNAFTLASRLSKSLTREVELQTAQVKSILQEIPQGIMCIVAPDRIDAAQSSKLSSILGRTFVPQDPWYDILFQDANLPKDLVAMAKDSIHCSLGELILNFDINSHCLPQRLTLRNSAGEERHLQLTWSPVANRNKIVEKVIVTLTDVTQDIMKAKKGEQRERQMLLISELISIPVETYRKFTKSTAVLLEQSEALILDNSERSLDFLRKVMINTHTIKGAARTLGLKTLASTLHEIETEFVMCQSLAYSEPCMQTILDAHRRLQAAFHEYNRINEEVLGRSAVNEDDVQVKRHLLEKSCYYFSYIKYFVRDQFMKLEISSVSDEVARHVYTDLRQIIEDCTMEIGQAAKDLGKPTPRMIVDPGDVAFGSLTANTIRNAFVHILRNSLDHGLESPVERRELGKTEEGNIFAKASKDRNRILVTFSDDGRGLALDKLKAKGVEKGLVTNDRMLDPHAIADLIFHPDLSTSDIVNQYSGRGVGMSAVRCFVQELGGDISLKLKDPSPSRGHCSFEIVLSLPLRESADYFESFAENPSPRCA